ncbi:uncharacterized protein [Primulina eburnea]|uniref:uncharacterized protein n=1 Tax=Primulina eburnea TaxID=1245227 RepID=UPI003C6C2508
MAEVSNLRGLNHHSLPLSRRSLPSTATNVPLQEESGEEEEFYRHHGPLFFNFDSFSSPDNPSNPTFLDDYTSSFNFDFEASAAENLDSGYEDPNCFFFGGEEDEEQMNFVTDLFESRETYLGEDPIWEFDSEPVDESGLEFGFGPGLGSNGGLRVADMDSESDSEEFEVNSGFVNNDDDNYDDGFEVNNENYHSANEREEFEWEEVSERLHFDEVENLNSVIDRIEEISVSSDISSSDGGNSMLGDAMREEDEGNIEWEVLLAMNNLERNFELENSAESIQESGIPHGNLRDREDYILALEYDTLFGQLVENENALKGSPPAAKSVVENLPSVVYTKEVVEENSCLVSCAVCMDEFAVGEKLTRMPCFHLYHGECILPWLHNRNTCPVCRYELPTDDADYERRRSERRGGGGLSASRLAISR